MPLLYIHSIENGHTSVGIFDSKEEYLRANTIYPEENFFMAPVYTREEVVEDLLQVIHKVLEDQIGIISTPYNTTQSRKAIEIVYRTRVFVLSDEGGDYIQLKQEMTDGWKKYKFWKNVKRFEITGTLQNWIQKANQIVELVTK